MFGNKKKLLSGGAQAEGTVMKTWFVRRHYLCVNVKVAFPDGSTGEFEEHDIYVGTFKLGRIVVGDVVPVRYDQADHSKAMLDVPLLEERQAQRVAEQQAAADRYAKTVSERLSE